MRIAVMMIAVIALLIACGNQDETASSNGAVRVGAVASADEAVQSNRVEHSDETTPDDEIASSSGVEHTGAATPAVEPTAEPTAEPTVAPTAEPTVEPTAEPTVEPTATPTVEPTVATVDENLECASPSPSRSRAPNAYADVSYLNLYKGPVTMEELALRSDVIVRGHMLSATPSYRESFLEGTSRTWRWSAVTIVFEVAEALKGGTERLIVIELEVPSLHNHETATSDEALASSRRWTEGLADEWPWSRRDAVLFLWRVANSKSSRTGRPNEIQFVFAGDPLDGRIATFGDTVSVRSPHNRAWLPATTDGRNAAAFYLEDPANENPATVSLAGLKTRIDTALAMVNPAIEGHGECVLRSLLRERSGPRSMARGGPPPEFWHQATRIIESGSPAGTLLDIDGHSKGGPSYPTYEIDGAYEGLFNWQLIDDDTDYSNGFTYELRTVRPLPKGEYVYYQNRDYGLFDVCDYTPTNPLPDKFTNIVVAPENVLHEMLFDPVTVNESILADATNGVLTPATFTTATGTSATIDSTSYESSAVKMTLSPLNGLTGHILDIIELDGTVSLSLDVFDATVDSANDTLSWSVSEQPWHDGDKLMVRIREGRK